MSIAPRYRSPVLWLALGTGFFAPATLPAADAPSQIEALAHSQDWLKLLHYDQRSGGRYVGRADAPGFYMSPNGKSDPSAEVTAAIDTFKGTAKSWGSIPMAPACVFPARFNMLARNGLLAGVARPTCVDFEEWRTQLDVESVTMIFASAYPNNPASMFGHTLLRLNHRRSNHPHPGVELLDYAVSFLARVNPDDDPMSYTIKGIFGGYLGVFNIDPYYTTVTIYSGSERRDLWEYPLRLSPDETSRLVEHLWELQLTGGFTYFFFDENCSFQILALLEAAAPRLSLLPLTGVMVLPHETLQTLVKTDLVEGSVSRRLSLESQLRHLRNQLTPEESRQLIQFMQSDSGSPQDLPPIVLDTAIAYFNVLNYQAKNRLPTKDRVRFNALLQRRAQITAVASYAPPKVESTTAGDPARGHGTHHARVGAGVGGQSPFLSVSWKMGFHDFLNSDSGYESFGSINFLDLEARQYGDEKFPRAGHLGVAEVSSLRPFDPLLPEFSWHMSLANDPALELDCLTCRKTSLRGGGGLTVASTDRRWLSYALGLVELDVAGTFRDGTSAGPGGRLGFILRDDRHHLKALLEGQTHNDWTGNHPRQNYRLLRLALSENRSRHEDVRIGLQTIPGDENYPNWLEWQVSYGRAF